MSLNNKYLRVPADERVCTSFAFFFKYCRALGVRRDKRLVLNALTALILLLFTLVSCYEKHENLDRMGYAVTDTSSVKSFSGDSSTYLSAIEKAYEQFRKAKDAEKASVANRLFEELYKEDYADSIIVFTPATSRKRVDFFAHYYMGEYFLSINRFDESIRSFEEARSFYSERNVEKEVLSDLLASLSVSFHRKGDFHRALESVKESYAIDQVSGDKERLSSSLNNMAGIYLAMKQPEFAEDIIVKAIGIERQLNRDRVLAIRLGMASEVYLQLNKPRQSLEYADEAYRLDMEGNRPHKAAVRQCQMANAYAHLKEYDRAQLLLDEAIPILTESGNIPSLSIAWLQLGKVNDALGKRKEALECYRQAIDNSVQAHVRYVEKNARYAAYKLMREMNHPDALMHLERYSELSDTMYKQESARMIEQYYALYKTEEIRKESEKHKEDLHFSILAGAVVAVLLLALVLFLAYRVRIQRLRSRMMQETEQARTDFFTGITHEFRTPITIISGFNEQLQEREKLSDSEYKRYTQAIDRQSNRLLSLVNQLLDITRLRSGNDHPEWRSGDIVGYLRMSVENYRLYAERKQVMLSFRTDVPVQEMDFVPFYINKVVSNLISNAIKHTPEGGHIDLSLRIVQNETLLVRVNDTGEGMAAEELSRIFDLFYRNEQSTDDMGTGIGLYFTRLLVEKMNGRIEVESTLGKGTTFTVHLPLHNRNKENIRQLEKNTRPAADTMLFSTLPAGEKDADELQTNADPDAPLLLVVEDNADVRLYLQRLLAPHYRLLTAADGEEGLTLAREHLPDLVVTDVMMPRKDGIALCTDLKEDVLLNHIPVIMLTARSTDEDRIAGLRSGVEAYIRKPFRTEELLVTIDNLFAARRRLQEKYARMMRDTVFTATRSGQRHENGMAAVKDESGVNEDSTTDSLIPEKKEINVVEKANVEFLDQVIVHIDDYIGNPELSPAFIASKMLLSLSQLNRKLNAITGQSASSHILCRRLTYARQQLDNPDYSITQVAGCCGFTDSSHFSRAFKKEYGITPTAYRNR